MNAQEVDLEFAKQFWTTANVVVSFSIAQVVAFGLTAAAAPTDKNNGLNFQIQQNFPVTVFLALLSAIASVSLVWFCQSAATEIASTLPRAPATTKYLGIFDALRIIATSLTGVLSVVLVISIKYPRASLRVRSGS